MLAKGNFDTTSLGGAIVQGLKRKLNSPFNWLKMAKNSLEIDFSAGESLRGVHPSKIQSSPYGLVYTSHGEGLKGLHPPRIHRTPCKLVYISCGEAWEGLHP